MRLSTLFQDLNGSSRSVAHANTILEDAIETVAAGREYMLVPSEEAHDAVHAEVAEIRDLLALLREEGSGADVFGNIEELLSSLDAVEGTFDRVIAAQEQVESASARMDAAGLATRAQLSALMESSFENSDAGGAFYAGRAQERLLLARFYMKEFLLSGLEEDFEEAESWQKAATTELARLDFIIFAEDRKAMANEAKAKLAEFWAASLDVRAAHAARVADQNEFLALGEGVELLVERAADALTLEQTNVASAGVGQARTTMVLLGIAVAISIGTLIFFSRQISALIVSGLESAMGDMRSLAGGNLDLEIGRKDEETELGEMARTLETFRQTAKKSQRLAEEARAREVQEAEQERARQKSESEARAAQREARERERKEIMASLADRLGSVAMAASRGDFSKRVSGSFGDPDLDSVARAMNEMMEKVERGVTDTARVLDGLSKGDLTARMMGGHEGVFAKLEKTLGETCATLSEMVGEILDQCEEIGVNTEEMRNQAGNLAKRAETQAAALEETAAAMEEMAATASSSAETASDATNVSRRALSSVAEAGTVVSSAVEAMGDIRSASDRIEEIVSVIDGIAFQTNLLALNASVEAARAGSAGKGFAVVATEVRALAQRSSEASKDIKELIEQSAAQVARGVGLVEKTGVTLEDIVASVREMGDTMEGLTSAAREQAVGAREVTGAVTQMDTITQQNAALADTSRASASQLNDKALALKALVERFTLSKDQNSRAPIAAE
ncbi:methyl-accepting chemotaxis protein [Kangsaoukella pontilimi]|nr:methyl-accepting chemotaxis protein [Kangsaoukella pontilimi]